jgi:hypothetical protein
VNQGDINSSQPDGIKTDLLLNQNNANSRADHSADNGSGLHLLEGYFSLPVSELLRRGNLRFEKCELKEAGRFFELALEKAKRTRDHAAISDSIAHLLRHASDIGDEAATVRWISELEIYLAQSETKLTPYAWYCKGIVAFRKQQHKKAQILFHRFWREIENAENNENAAPSTSTHDSSPMGDSGAPSLEKTRDHMRAKAQALLALALVAQAQGKTKRAQYLGEVILNYAEKEHPRSILTSTYLLLCRNAERQNHPTLARKWLQKAFATSVSEHNWYHYLFVLYGFARVCRIEQDFVQARFYLDLLEKAIVQDEFKNLRHDIAEERLKLNLNRVDLEIDLNRCVVRTREGEINLRRQHLLIEILHQLVAAPDHGLSKALLIQKVWQEPYQPDVHDGKLYYNINRLRKLIEPDQKNPQYLMNWRQGYRLAPELRVRLVGTKGAVT